jgi:hypothetical protein
MNELLKDTYVVRDINNLYILKVLDEHLQGHNGFAAGGCFKNLFNKERLKDIDVFFESERDFAEACIYFEGNESYYFYYENKKVKAFKHEKSHLTIELIRSVFGKPVDILEHFDFSIVKFAYYKEIIKGEKGNPFLEISDIEDKTEFKVMHHKDFFEHLFFKRLVIDNPLTFPIGTFERALRYKGYGYSLCRESKHNLITDIKNSTNATDDFSLGLYEGWD